MAETAEVPSTTLTDHILQWTSSLDSEDRVERETARHALVNAGSAAVPALIECTRAEEAHVRWEATKALGEIAHPDTAPTLIVLLDDDDSGVRWLAAEALLGLEREAIPPLLEALEHPGSTRMRQAAYHVLRRFPCWRIVELLAPVMDALEHTASEVTVPIAAGAALESIREERLLVHGPARREP